MDTKQDMEFEEMMEQRLKENFTGVQDQEEGFSDERLKDMNKKLPSWSLEPPYSFLK